ncbi:MAG: hypothetical protein AAGG48_27300 [Planctomycetota bacterium]
MRLGSGATSGRQFASIGKPYPVEKDVLKDTDQIRINLNWIQFKDGDKWTKD